MQENRRQLLTGGAVAGLALAIGVARGRRARAGEKFEVVLTDAEWRKRLDPLAFEILRREGTETPGSSALDHQFAKGRYRCRGCDLDLFASETKFDSQTGWPSFWKPLDNAVGERRDSSFLMERVEVHCRRCGGHLGHVFKDGPQPTGLRYCMNGAAMTFHAA